MNSPLTPHYSRSFSGFVWKILPDPSNGLIWIEVRDEDEMAVKFYKVDLETTSDQQVELPIEIEWWHHICTGFGSSLGLLKIEDQSNPGDSRLMLIDVIDQSVFFDQPGTVIESVVDSVVQYRAKGDTELSKVDLSSYALTKKVTSKLLMPSVYAEGSSYHDTVGEFLLSKKVKASGPICYLEEGSNILITYHFKLEKQVSRHLLWLKDGKELHNRTMDSKMKGYSHESFLAIGNYLILLFERKHLEIYLLN